MAEPPKITIMKGASQDLSAATYRIMDETHTVGNSLRWMIMRNPKVEFCGYSVPHPSENAIQIRIQMYDGLSSLDALTEALDHLDDLFKEIDDAFVRSVQSENYEKWIEKS